MSGLGAGCYTLHQVLTEEHVSHILAQVLGTSTTYNVVASEVNPAAEGLVGFMAEHVRVVLHVKLKDQVKKVPLFVKRVPVDNGPKRELVKRNKLFERETMVMQFMAQMDGAEGPSPFRVKAYVYTSSMLVMPDLAAAGYSVHPPGVPLDLPHVLLVAASLARLHAAFANYETKEIINATRDTFYERNKHLLTEAFLNEESWLRAAAKLSADFLHAFSSKYTRESVPDLEHKLFHSYVRACDSVAPAAHTLNVVLHKDLWNNNILFKYEAGAPSNAVLVDYQCVRYAPPAFDLMSFLHLTTCRAFREEHEREVLRHYWEVFSSSLDSVTRKRVSALEYCKAELARRCEGARMYSAFHAAVILPFVLMDSHAAQHEFHDPDSFQAIMTDRSPPVLRYARLHHPYTQRLLEASEAYVQMFIVER